MGGAGLAQCGFPFTAKISVHADDIIVFVFRRLDIKAVKKAVAMYEQIAGSKINFDKSEDLQLRARQRACQGLPAGVTDLSATGAKLVGGSGQGRCPGGYLVSAVILKRQGGGVRRVHLPLDPLPFVCTSSVKESWDGASTIPLQTTLGRLKPMVRRQVCCQRPCNWSLSMPDLENHWFAERLAYLRLHGVETKGQRYLFSPQVRPQDWRLT